MDERLAKALEFSNYRSTIENQKRNLRSRVDSLQTITYNNGSFKANKETISFVSTLIDLGNDEIVIVDERSNPIEINDPKDFLTTLVEAYMASMNEFLAESKKLAKARSIKKIMDW
tara:strand:+ start:28682 stop:29029 length:348 start_codon:yes stop_codon:yes gene_type:complete